MLILAADSPQQAKQAVALLMEGLAAVVRLPARLFAHSVHSLASALAASVFLRVPALGGLLRGRRRGAFLLASLFPGRFLHGQICRVCSLGLAGQCGLPSGWGAGRPLNDAGGAQAVVALCRAVPRRAQEGGLHKLRTPRSNDRLFFQMVIPPG